jgi:hypothetical protein
VLPVTNTLAYFCWRGEMFYSIENSSSFSRGPWGIFPQTFGFRGDLLVVHSCYYATLVLPFPSIPPALPPPPAITPHTTILSISPHTLHLFSHLPPTLLPPSPSPLPSPLPPSSPPSVPQTLYEWAYKLGTQSKLKVKEHSFANL